MLSCHKMDMVKSDAFFFSFALNLSYKDILLKTSLDPYASFTSLMELCHILYIAYGIYCMQLFHIALTQPMEQF